jgi:alkaline phosphatase D
MAVTLRDAVAHAAAVPCDCGVVGGDHRGWRQARPALSRAGDRPVITHGVQSGDVSLDSGIVWARADRPARMLVEIATSDSFKTIRSAAFVDAFPETDFTAKALLEGLPAGQDVFYRIRSPRLCAV